jgi:hypothetical protein
MVILKYLNAVFKTEKIFYYSQQTAKDDFLMDLFG